MTADVIHVNHTRGLLKRMTKSHMNYKAPKEIRNRHGKMGTIIM